MQRYMKALLAPFILPDRKAVPALENKTVKKGAGGR